MTRPPCHLPGGRPATPCSGCGAPSPRQRQYALLAAILGGGVGLLWLIFAFTGNQPAEPAAAPAGQPTARHQHRRDAARRPGQSGGPVGRHRAAKLAQYENEREEQDGSTRNGRPSRPEDDAALSRNWSSG